jgi:hypothetical protein
VKNPHPLPYGYGVDGYGYGSRKIYPGVTRVTPYRYGKSSKHIPASGKVE